MGKVKYSKAEGHQLKLYIPVDLHRSLQDEAVSGGVSMSFLMTQILSGRYAKSGKGTPHVTGTEPGA